MPHAVSPLCFFRQAQEFGAIAELLRRGYDVYVTLVDDQGIDCIVRQGPRRKLLRPETRLDEIIEWLGPYYARAKDSLDKVELIMAMEGDLGATFVLPVEFQGLTLLFLGGEQSLRWLASQISERRHLRMRMSRHRSGWSIQTSKSFR